MKNYKLIIFPILFVLVSACSKEEPPMGKYIGDFYADGVIETNIIFDIIGTNETYIILRGESTESASILRKNGEKAIGTLFHSGFQSFIYVDVTGEWKKSGKHYIISGTFTTRYRVEIDPETYDYVDITGTFELKSYAI